MARRIARLGLISLVRIVFNEMFSIQLVKQPHYDPEDHFDILRNHWKLDRLVENIEKAQSICIGPNDIIRS